MEEVVFCTMLSLVFMASFIAYASILQLESFEEASYKMFFHAPSTPLPIPIPSVDHCSSMSSYECSLASNKVPTWLHVQEDEEQTQHKMPTPGQVYFRGICEIGSDAPSMILKLKSIACLSWLSLNQLEGNRMKAQWQNFSPQQHPAL